MQDVDLTLIRPHAVLAFAIQQTEASRRWNFEVDVGLSAPH